MDKNVFWGITAAIIIGFATVIGTQLAKILNPILVLVFSYLISVIFIFLLSLITKERLEFKKLLKNKKDFITVLLGRSLIGTLVLTFGLRLTTAMHVIFMLKTEPAFVMVLSYFFLKEKINLKKIILTALLIIGTFIFVTSLNFGAFTSYQIGDLLIVTAVAIFAYTYLSSRKLMRDTSPTTVTFASNLIAGILLLPSLIFIKFSINNQVITYTILYALMFFTVGLYFFFKSLKHLKPWIVSSLLTLGLLSGALLTYLWLGETLNPIQLIGGLIIVASSYSISKEKVTQ